MLSRTTQILFAAALLAAGVYFAVVRPHDRKSDEGITQNDRLVAFNFARVDSISVARPQDTVSFTLWRADSTWSMTAPFSEGAEPRAIGSLVDAIGTADINRNLGAQQDLAPYGLDHPDAVITLAAAHNAILRIAVGKNTVDDAWCYARAEPNGEVLLIPTDVRRSSTLPVDEYRDRRVVVFQVREVSAYRIHTKDQDVTWIRRRKWYALAGRDTVFGDSIAVTAPLHRLRGLRASSFLTTSDLPAPPSPADRDYVEALLRYKKNLDYSMSLSFHDVGSEIAFTHVGNEWHAYAGGRIMVVGDDIADLFAHTVTELRERRLLQFDPAVTRRINYAAPTATGELVRAGGRWAFPNPMMGRVNAEYAADFVRALRALKWSEPGDEAARTTGRVSYRIEIMGEGDRIIDQLTAGPYDASTSWVTSRSSRGTWLVENGTLDEVSKRFARLKER